MNFYPPRPSEAKRFENIVHNEKKIIASQISKVVGQNRIEFTNQEQYATLCNIVKRMEMTLESAQKMEVETLSMLTKIRILSGIDDLESETKEGYKLSVYSPKSEADNSKQKNNNKILNDLPRTK